MRGLIQLSIFLFGLALLGFSLVGWSRYGFSFPDKFSPEGRDSATLILAFLIGFTSVIYAWGDWVNECSEHDSDGEGGEADELLVESDFVAARSAPQQTHWSVLFSAVSFTLVGASSAYVAYLMFLQGRISEVPESADPVERMIGGPDGALHILFIGFAVVFLRLAIHEWQKLWSNNH